MTASKLWNSFFTEDNEVLRNTVALSWLYNFNHKRATLKSIGRSKFKLCRVIRRWPPWDARQTLTTIGEGACFNQTGSIASRFFFYHSRISLWNFLHGYVQRKRWLYQKVLRTIWFNFHRLSLVNAVLHNCQLKAFIYFIFFLLVSWIWRWWVSLTVPSLFTLGRLSWNFGSTRFRFLLVAATTSRVLSNRR